MLGFKVTVACFFFVVVVVCIFASQFGPGWPQSRIAATISCAVTFWVCGVFSTYSQGQTSPIKNG